MPLYLDVHHKVDGLTTERAADAHKKDLAVQGKYGVNYIRYWYDEGTGKVFCLVHGPEQGGGRRGSSRGPRRRWRTRSSRSRKAHRERSRSASRGRPRAIPGARATDAAARQCRQDNPPGAKFCSGCGGRLEVAVPSVRACQRCPAVASATSAGGRCGAARRRAALASPQRLHAAVPRREDPDLPPCARGRAQAGDGAVRRHEGLARVARRPRPRGRAQAPGPCPRAHDGSGPPLRGHREPGDGRRDHGALRRPPRPRGSRRARLLRRPRHAAGDSPLHGGGPPGPRLEVQIRIGLNSGEVVVRADRQRSPHGLLGGRPDHASRRAHGAARDAGDDAPDRRDAPARRGVRPRRPARPRSRSRAWRAGRGVRAGRPVGDAHAPPGRGGAGTHPLRGARPGAGPPPPSPRPGARRSGAGRRRGGRARRGQITSRLGVHPLAPDAGLARARVELRLLRQGHRVPARHRPLQELLRDRGARRRAEDPGEGHGEAPDAGRGASGPGAGLPLPPRACRPTTPRGTPSTPGSAGGGPSTACGGCSFGRARSSRSAWSSRICTGSMPRARVSSTRWSRACRPRGSSCWSTTGPSTATAGGARPTTASSGSTRCLPRARTSSSARCSGSDEELEPLKHLLVERAEGVPFFLEECVRTLVETGALAGERGAYRLARPPTPFRCRPRCRPSSRPGSIASRRRTRPCSRPRPSSARTSRSRSCRPSPRPPRRRSVRVSGASRPPSSCTRPRSSPSWSTRSSTR